MNFNIKTEPFSNHQQQQQHHIMSNNPISAAVPIPMSEELKNKYMKGLEERLLLVQDKNRLQNELMEKDKVLNQVLSYVQALESTPAIMKQKASFHSAPPNFNYQNMSFNSSGNVKSEFSNYQFTPIQKGFYNPYSASLTVPKVLHDPEIFAFDSKIINTPHTQSSNNYTGANSSFLHRLNYSPAQISPPKIHDYKYQNVKVEAQEFNQIENTQNISFTSNEDLSSQNNEDILQPISDQSLPNSANVSPTSIKLPSNFITNNSYNDSVLSESDQSYDEMAPQINLDDDQLICWTDMIKEHKPGLLKSKSKSLLESYVYIFLKEHLTMNQVRKCYITRDGKNYYAIPEELTDDFENFIDELVIEFRIRKRAGKTQKKNNQQQNIANKEQDSFFDSANQLGMYAASDYSDDNDSSIEKSTAKSKSSKNSVNNSKLSPTSIQGFSKKKCSQADTIYKPWMDIVHMHFPSLVIDLRNMPKTVDQFLKSNRVKEKMMTDSSGLECKGIPDRLTVNFIKFFSRMHVNANQTISQEDPNLLSLVNDSKIAHKLINGKYIFAWRDLALSKYPETDVLHLRSIVYNRTLKGVHSFVSEHAPDLEIAIEDCRLRANSGAMMDGIPFDVVNDFYAWFELNLKNRFLAYQINCPEQELKRALPAEFILKDEPASKNPKPNYPEPLVKEFTNDYGKKLFSSVLTHNNENVCPTVKKDKKANFEKKKLIRYNQIFQAMMPTYNSVPKETRVKIKAKVEEYLIEKLGSKEKLKENVIWARSQGIVFSTFGISEEWEDEFRSWACPLLRCLFGIESVPIQTWEEIVTDQPDDKMQDAEAIINDKENAVAGIR